MPEISDSAVVQQKLGSLPLVTYQAGDTVLTAGSRSGQLLILKSGASWRRVSKDACALCSFSCC